MSDLVLTKETSPPIPPVGCVSIYPKSDGKLYRADGDTQAESEIGGIGERIIQATTDIAALVIDDIIVCSGNMMVTLPDATTAYKRLVVKNIGAGSVSISGVAGQLIDGQSNVMINDQFESLTVAPFGATWLLI
jgi:hypothetical protein